MDRVLSVNYFPVQLKSFLIDLLLMSFIYFLPSLSHLVSFPVYYLDPMKIALTIALVHTSKRNSYFIALTLPVFSFLISSHPQLIKSVLISAELIIMLSLFFYLNRKFKNEFISLALSMAAGKIIYYVSKLALINAGWINDSLFSTPVYYQVCVMVGLSMYLAVIRKPDR